MKDLGDCWYDEDAVLIKTYDEKGRLLTHIYCPYIPKIIGKKMDEDSNILPRDQFEQMLKDDEHEAYGAMVHRQLVEERTNTRNYHDDIKRAMDVAVQALKRITAIYFYDNELADGRTAYRMDRNATEALKEVEKILK